MSFKFMSLDAKNFTEYFEEGGTDTKKFYKKNKMLYGKDWYYYNKEISYVYNEQGFRTLPFKDVVWENSIVMFGCSNVKGTGHPIEDTLSSLVEKVLNIPVINLGISGSAVDLACWNSLILHDHYPKPKAIVHLWTSLDRYTDYNGKDLKLQGIYNKRDYCFKHIWDKRSKLYIKADNALWKDKTIYYQASFFEHTSIELGIDFYKTIDAARDRNHPGVESNKIAATRIAENLIKLGIGD